MWRLTIEQKRKSEYSDGVLTEKVSFEDANINKFANVITALTQSSDVLETSYRIEWKEKEK